MNSEETTQNNEGLIHYDDVSKIYMGDSVAVKDITLSIDPTEFISIVGHSGSGKTTLLKLLLAEEKPSSGSVLFESNSVHRLSGHEQTRLRRRIGMIFQDFRLLPDKTAYENIAFAMEAAGRSDGEIESDVPYALNLVGMSDKSWHFPAELSGGEKQRLAIARAVVNQPDVVIADEPTGNLDPKNTYDVVEILKKVNSLGTTVILSTHNKGVVDILENRVVTLEDGRIIRDDKSGSYIL